MKIAHDIDKLGFRRWYERQLIEGHLYLVFAFLALIAILSGIELLDFQRSPLTWGGILVMCAAGAMLVLIAWRRFMTLMARAELFANGAACPRCAAWGAPRSTASVLRLLRTASLPNTASSSLAEASVKASRASASTVSTLT